MERPLRSMLHMVSECGRRDLLLYQPHCITGDCQLLLSEQKLGEDGKLGVHKTTSLIILESWWFYFVSLGSPRSRPWNKDSKTSIHLGSKGNIRDGVGECDKEEYLIKLATTVCDGSLIPLGQLHDTSHCHHI